MPAIINPTITDAGLAAAVAAEAGGIAVAITHISLGSGAYIPVGNETALASLVETVTIGSGGVVDDGSVITVNVIFPPVEGPAYVAREIGFYLGDPATTGTLFAVYSNTDVDGIVQRSSLDFVAQFSLGLTRVPPGSVTVNIDPAMALLYLMLQDHREEVDPHPGYLQSSNMVGAIMPFAMLAPPPGWLSASGQAVSRTTYAALFAAIGTTYGAGNGTTTFNLPDLRGEFVRGLDVGRGVDVGRTIGSNQAHRMQDHFHGTGDFLAESNDDWYGILRNWVGSFSSRWVAGESQNRQLKTSDGAGLASTATRNTGTTDQMLVPGTETRPRNIALLYCIKH